MRNQMWAVAAFAAAALTVAGCSSGSSGSSAGSTSTPSSSSGTQPTSTSASGTTATIEGARVLTDAKGFTLSSFGPDTSTTSTCNGQCATFWPPVKGPVTAMAGITG